MKDKKKKSALIVWCTVGVIILEYITGVIAQIIAPPVLTPAMTYIKEPVSLNPIIAIPKAFTTIPGLIVNGFLFIVICLFIFFGLSKEDDKIWDPRGFYFSTSGEYGTAHFMTDGERERCLETTNINDTFGNIIGYIGADPTFIDSDQSSGFNYKQTESPDAINSKIVSIPRKTRLGPHVAVFGASGSGKSFCFSRNLMFQCAERGESMIVTDPKGELYNDMTIMLKRMGYVVRQFNLKTPSKSDSWNCLLECISQGEENVQLLVQQFTSIIISNTTPPGGSGGGDSAFFDAAEGSLLSALCLITLLQPDGSLKPELIDILNSPPPDPFARNRKLIVSDSLGTVFNLLSNQEEMEKRFQELRRINPDHPALKSYSGYEFGSDNVKGNIITGLSNRLQVLQADIIQEIVGYYDIDLVLPAKQKAVYFIIISDQEATLKFLASLFFTFMFVRLVNYADSRPSQKCDVPVNMIMDEFPNIGIIPDFTKKISTVRSRDLRLIIIFQNLAQLEERYPNGQWQEILGNCDTQICLGVRDEKTAKYLSDKCGSATIINVSHSVTKKALGPQSPLERKNESTGKAKRELMTSDEIQKLKSNKLIAFIAGQQPIVLDKYGYIYHPRKDDMTPCSFEDNKPIWLEPFARKKAAERERVKLISQGNISG